MATRAVITRRGAVGIARSEAAAMTESIEAGNLGLTVEHHLPQGTLVSGTDKQYEELEARGYRVKVLRDTNILEVGSYRIDTESTLSDTEASPPDVPQELDVPEELRQSWSHHLVQLAGPREEDWIKAIESQGVDVVEPISAYGLFVVGSPEQAERLKTLPFVAWVGPFKPAYRIHPNLSGRTDTIKYVSIGIYPEAEVDVVKAALEEAKGSIFRESSPQEHNGKYTRLVVEVDAKSIPSLASLPGVRWIEYASPEPGLDGERETQIVAENLDNAAAPNTAPIVGYQAWLTGLGLSGAGVTIAICDTGVDAGPNNNATGHLDLRGRQAAFIDYTAGGTTTDTDGHGTHVAGIAIGNAATGQTEEVTPNNFLWGQGMAPQSNYVTQNALMGPWPPANWGSLTQDSINNGAQVQNNSWWDGGPAGSGYTANARRYDQLVRDPNEATTVVLESLIIVFSAGNAGPNASTITPPKEAKNPITVGNSLTFRPGVGADDDIRGIATSSSRGPALDGRILPNVVAPGTNVSSCLSESCGRTAIAGTGTPDPANPANQLNQYLYLTGTSMAAPHVTGCCALLTEWWRKRTNGKNPSPALVKALLINGAEDLAGGPDGRGGNLTNIPNNDQGWGRVSLENIVLQAPASDRGPKIFSDQRHAFTTNGQEHTIRISPVDTARPMRITLVWTDAAGAVNANPALVNDLDLEVNELSTGNVYRGNVFANGFSITGGAFDDRNNIECVYIQHPTGTYEVTIIAASIAASARPDITTPWQDFALVIDNAEGASTAPVSVAAVIDCSGSMIYSGYVDITKTSSKQFVDLMSVDDHLGVVSFASSSAVEYPMQTITGQPVKDAAKTAIDGIVFGGCTFMGGGINEACALLETAEGSRAIVLLSDGYDNKGCDAANPAKPSALEAAASLPGNMPVYTCAMGPASDQALLKQIAELTDGQYYYMPIIDDLFEIYNYIRGQVTGDAIVVNESAMASSSRVAAFVDAQATEATFTVAWADEKLHFVTWEPMKPHEVSIRLRDPRGRLLHHSDSYLLRIVGQGHVAFKLQEPMPGKWHVEVTTARETHVRYTVGGFVKSPLRLNVDLWPKKQISAGVPLGIAARMLDGQHQIAGFRATSRIIHPTLGVPGLLDRYKQQLSDIKPDQLPGGDMLPLDIAKLTVLRTKLLQEQKHDIFSHDVSDIKLRAANMRDLIELRLESPTDFDTPVGPGEMLTDFSSSRRMFRSSDTVRPSPATAGSAALIGQFKNTWQQGSYNVVVIASGTSPVSGTRFVRKEMVSVRVQ